MTAMPIVDERSRSSNANPDARQLKKPSSDWFALPALIKHIFDAVPLKTYPPPSLPQRAPERCTTPTLYIFTTTKCSSRGEPSFNPACLKWQTYLKFCGIGFKTAPANNHASPTGALPFLLTELNSEGRPASPITGNKIWKWAGQKSNRQEWAPETRLEAYLSLLDHPVRSAWLLSLYLHKENFEAVAKPLYINTASSNPIVRATLAFQLQKAAREELLKYSPSIDEEDLYVGLREAFQALSNLLGDNKYFTTPDKPGLFDASVFAYTHLTLEEKLGWENKRMSAILKSYENLVHHRQRILVAYF